MKRKAHIPFAWQILFIFALYPKCLGAEQSPPPTASDTNQQSAPQNVQAVSQTGLLPVYGVDVRLDPSWVDAAQLPSQSPNFPNSGTSAAFQQLWGALQPGGYNVLRIPIDLRDASGAANRAANLCLWSQNNGVKLILVLTGADAGKPIGRDFAKQASDFVSALIALLRGGNGQYLTSYSQIMAYQLEGELNHAGRHGGMTAAAAQKLALDAAQALRKTEGEALNGTGLQATPLMASASFDFELVKAGAVAGGTLTDAAYNQAYQALKQFLAGLTGSADFDVVGVDWFAGSVGGGGVEKAPALLKSLTADVPGKQIVLTIGFSTAFRSADEQKRLFATAFANLSDYRASAGADCPFVGTIFREALNGNNPNPKPPRSTLPGEMDKWDWQAKAAELAAMWTAKKKSVDMSWWLTKVENNMGLVTLESDARGNMVANPLPAQQGMVQIATAVSDVNAQMATTPPAANTYAQQPGATADAYSNPATNPYGQPTTAQGNPVTDPNATYYNQPTTQQPGAAGTPGMAGNFSQSLMGVAQRNMLSLLDGVFQRLNAKALAAGGGGFNSGPNTGYNPGYNTNTSTGTNFNTNPSSSNVPETPYNYYNTGSTNSSAGQPGSSSGNQPGTVAPANVQLGPQDVTLQPMAPQVGQTATINATLRNAGGTDAYGLIVQAVGDDSAILAQADGLHVAPNSSTAVPLQWVPTEAKSSYGITIKVGDGFGSQLASMQLNPVAIAPPAISSSPGTATGVGGGTAPGAGGAAPSVSTPDSGGTPTTAGGTGAGGGTASNPPTPDSGGTPTTAGGTGTEGGTGSNPPTTVSGGTSGTDSGNSVDPGGQPRLVSPIGAVKLAGLQFGNSSAPPVSGQPLPVVVAVSNPYRVPMNNLKVGLLVDGKLVQTQTMSLLLPQQNRSVLFQGVNFPQAGRHEVKVTVESQRPGAQPQTAVATQGVVISAATKTGAPIAGGVLRIGGRTGNTNPPTTQRGLVATTAAPAPPPAVVRSVTPTTFQIGRMVVLTRPGLPAQAGPPSVATTATTSSNMLPLRLGPPAGINPTPKPGVVGATATPVGPATRSLPPRPGSIGTGGTTGAPASVATTGPGLPPASAGAPVRPSPPAVGGAPATTTAASLPQVSVRPGLTATGGTTGAPASVRAIGTGMAPASSGAPPRPGPLGTTATGGGGAAPAGRTGVSVPPASSGAPPRPGPTSATTAIGLQIPARPGLPAQGGSVATGTAVPPISGRPGLSGSAASTLGTAGRPGPAGSAPAAAGQGSVDLSVTGPGVFSMNVPQPRAGQAITFSVTITNNGTAGVQGASVVFQLFGDNRLVSGSQPIRFDIGGRNSTYRAVWSTTLPPAGREMQLKVLVSANGDVNPANNSNTFPFTMQPQILLRR